jgi:hypothetical protein
MGTSLILQKIKYGKLPPQDAINQALSHAKDFFNTQLLVKWEN